MANPNENILSPGQTQVKVTSIPILAWSVFLIGVLYYCFAYLLRVYPSIMEPDLRSYFHINAGGFGLLTSFYYFAYAPMQLPVGVSVDRIGPRRSLIMACMVSIVGVFLFANFDSFALALIGRFMVGLGAAFAYVTALKLASVWLPRKYFATATGLVTGCGMLAAIFTNIYLTHIIQVSGFKHAMYFPLLVGAALLVLIFLVVRDKPKQTLDKHSKESEAHALSYKQLTAYLKQIVKSRQMWLIGIIGTLLYLPASVFLDVWAIPYLRHVRHLSPENAAYGASIMLTGWICSSFTSCALSDLLGTRKKPLVIACFMGIIISSLILFTGHMSVFHLYVLLFLFGLCCGPHPLCFTLAKENNDHKVSGTAVSFANFIIMIGGFIQLVVGRILDHMWNGQMADGIRIYSAHSYVVALCIIPIGLVIAAVCTLSLKETYR